MSYDIRLIDPSTKETIILDEPHLLAGGTYNAGGTREAWLNVTYNYADHFVRVLGERGIRCIYGLTGEQSVAVLEHGIEQLNDDVSDNYWVSTQGNAKRALKNLAALARLAPRGIWVGD